MSENIISKLNNSVVKTKLIPIECLAKIKADIKRFGETDELNGFQKWIVNEGYMLDVPKLPFEVKSIIISAVKFELVNIIFNYEGKRAKDMFCVLRKGVDQNTCSLLSQNGYNVEYESWLPRKRLAVCSGLAEYGKNNITYIDGWGSFYELQTFLTDMPCEQDYTWQEVCHMKSCDRCSACFKNCPTGSIKDNRFLIDNEICLSNLSESEAPYPDWVPSSAHHSIYGCYGCQNVCPKNKNILSNVTEEICFSEEETNSLLCGTKKESMPKELLNKLERIGIDDWTLHNVPKNLKVLLDNPKAYIS